MKNVVMTLFILSVIILAQNSDYNVYSPDQILIPKYRVKKSLDDSYRVYDSKQVVIPKYIVKPDPTGKGYKVYEADKPILPLYRIEKGDQP